MAASTKVQVGGIGRTSPNVFTSTSAPTVDNDASNGCHVGDLWLKTDTTKLYVCFSDSAGAASWVIMN